MKLYLRTILKQEKPQKDQENEFINSIERYIKQKWQSKILLKIKDYVTQHVALIDSGAVVNCIREGIIPSKYFVKTTHRINAANGNHLQVSYKIPKAHICVNGVCIKTSFILIKDLKQGVILRTPFINLLKPFSVDEKGIHTKVKRKTHNSSILQST